MHYCYYVNEFQRNHAFVPILHQSHLPLPVVASAVLALVMQMVRKQQSAAAASSPGARRGVAAAASAAESGCCGVVSAPRGTKEGTVVTTSASASGQTQGRATAPAGMASRARGQIEGSAATANAILQEIKNDIKPFKCTEIRFNLCKSC